MAAPFKVTILTDQCSRLGFQSPSMTTREGEERFWGLVRQEGGTNQSHSLCFAFIWIYFAPDKLVSGFKFCFFYNWSSNGCLIMQCTFTENLKKQSKICPRAKRLNKSLPLSTYGATFKFDFNIQIQLDFGGLNPMGKATYGEVICRTTADEGRSSSSKRDALC